MILQIYIAGGYLALILYALLLENNNFREYFSELIKLFLNKSHIKNVHPYSAMQTLSIFCLVLSWISFIGIIAVVYDFLKMKKQNKNKEIENYE